MSQVIIALFLLFLFIILFLLFWIILFNDRTSRLFKNGEKRRGPSGRHRRKLERGGSYELGRELY